jgi:hypothetical protein
MHGWRAGSALLEAAIVVIGGDIPSALHSDILIR